MIKRFVCLLFVCGVCLAADESSQPSLTIYNQDFAVIRQNLALDLKSGVNSVQVNDITMHLEPDSVILRDPSGKHAIQILEQNYRADPVSQQSLLSLFEGKTIDFQVGGDNGPIVQGKVIRSGYVPLDYMAMNGSRPYVQPTEPLIEVNGKLRFGLPGMPLFPSLGDDSILKPELQWLLSTDKPGRIPSEFSYVTGGLTWLADYNIIAPEKGDTVDLVGWVTIDNQSGKTFDNARIKLMAGDVNKIQAGQNVPMNRMAMAASEAVAIGPPVTEKTFDEYHLYTLARSTTLRDHETKQVEFVRATGISATRVYIYDGAKIDSNRYNGWNWENIRNDHNYGTESNSKIWVMREFVNSEANHLGMPLPKGRVRFYRRGDDAQVEFTGENVIDHTPRDETIRIYTGNAFDLEGKRRRTDYALKNNLKTADESFEIKVRNHKKEPVDVRVVEHLYRWTNWEISAKSDDFKKTDSQTIEFPVTIAPDGEKTMTYTAHYSW